jgi:hypothetical protein
MASGRPSPQASRHPASPAPSSSSGGWSAPQAFVTPRGSSRQSDAFDPSLSAHRSTRARYTPPNQSEPVQRLEQRLLKSLPRAELERHQSRLRR